MMDDGMSDMDGMGGMMVWMVLGTVVFVVLVVVATVAIFSMLQRRSRDHDQVPVAASPDDVLRQRYAAGEIDEDELARRRAGLAG